MSRLSLSETPSFPQQPLLLAQHSWGKHGAGGTPPAKLMRDFPAKGSSPKDTNGVWNVLPGRRGGRD